jgi:hypothetical protein
MRFPLLAAAGAALLSLSLWSCFGSDGGSTGPQPSAYCAEISDSIFPGADSLGPPMYQVISPNGGETFKVGGTMRVVVTGGANVATSVVEIWRFSHAGNQFAKLPGSPGTSFDPRKDCQFTFTVPESLASGAGSGGKFSLVSDSLKIRVAHYSDGANSFDFSDALFGVAK